MRIGVFGGTFDPIHIGHLIAAEEARHTLRLERVLFAPASQPPHKEMEGVTPVRHRVRMVELALEGNPAFELSMVDLDRPGPSYTVETLRLLHRDLGPGTEIFFIVGMDSLAELRSWRDPEQVIALCRLAVLNRPPYPDVDTAELERGLPGISDRIVMVRMPGVNVASSDLRERVSSGLPIKYQVPAAVERYILENRLYR
ncbi:MAG TPA: nicotinate-nucleotide adenylyltransferase [Chloroflexota bacterium]